MVEPRFSFKYGGVPYSELKIERRGDIIILPDGIEIKTTTVTDEAAGVIWWTNHFSNPTDHESRLITELWDCDIDIPMEPDPVRTRRNGQYTWEPDTFVLYETNGTQNSEADYKELPETLWENSEPHKTACQTGRSGSVRQPYFDLNRRDAGALIAVGWTGQWHALTTRKHDYVNFKSGIETTNFKILPGESFRTASTAVLLYNNGRAEAHNRFRHFMRMISPLGNKGRGEHVPFSAIFWGGVSSEVLIKRWKDIIAEKLPFDTCWIDAGWYEPLTEPTMAAQLPQWMNIGDWRVSKAYHPDGYKEVVRFLNANNIDFMLWCEPERVRNFDTGWAKLLDCPGYGAPSRLLALNDDEMLEKITEIFGNLIEELNVRVYRQDFNIIPIDFWRTNEEEDRKGMVEIRYINNLYKYWDALLARFPRLLIDNCCGGGNRNDIEMLSRSVPMWKSDYQCLWNVFPEGDQNQNMSSASWFPYSGMGYGPDLGDLYRWRSAYNGGITVRTWEHADPEFDVGATGEPLDWARKYFNEYISVRDYFHKDYYMLTQVSSESTSWAASEFVDSEDNSGIILGFRRARCPSETAGVRLGGIKAGLNYKFTNEDTEETFIVSGKYLLENEFVLRLPEKRSCCLWRFRAV